MKWSALIGVGLLGISGAAFARAPLGNHQPPAPPEGAQATCVPSVSYEAGPGSVPSAKTPKPSRVVEKYSIAAGQTASAKTPK
jgi:hypothetical protein